MNTSSVWIGYEWGAGITKVVSSYEVRYNNGSCCEQRGPKNWTLQGWNGSTWVTVDTVTNQSGWYANPSRSFSVDTPGAYSRYRLNITADNYNSPSYPITLVSIADIKLYSASTYSLRLDSIHCWWKHDLAGGDEPRLYVNGSRVWSSDHFDRDQTASLTHIARISIPSGGLTMTLDEYDDWPGSTVNIPAWPGPGIIYANPVGPDPVGLDFMRGDSAWYTVYYTVACD
ncbi:MAG: hypothetical protein EOO70_07830 [Myxococcaceae bacterium]|nr:MAG: hypothetical protein EOO70_07830 [Myxococcaceae bacterium]